MTEQKHYTWQDGLPTAPDVQLLLEKFPGLRVGDRVPYVDVQAVINVAPGSNRWRSITDQWRKRLRDKSLVVECENGEAFYIATADQVSAATYGVLRSISRKSKTHRRKLSLSKPENETQAKTIAHQAKLLQTMEREAKKARMNLLPSTEIKPAPKIGLPDAAHAREN